MVVVRRIEPADAEVLKRVRLAALLDAPSAFGSVHAAEAGRPDSDWAERARAGSEGDARVTFFAESAGDVVGLVGGFRIAPAARRVDLVSMWVAPQARRHGIARRLVDAVLGWAANTQAVEVTLWVTKGNVAAESLYESMGFVPTGATQPLPSDPSKQEIELVIPMRTSHT